MKTTKLKALGITIALVTAMVMLALNGYSQTGLPGNSSIIRPITVPPQRRIHPIIYPAPQPRQTRTGLPPGQAKKIYGGEKRTALCSRTAEEME